jgi:hypothetical protein
VLPESAATNPNFWLCVGCAARTSFLECRRPRQTPAGVRTGHPFGRRFAEPPGGGGDAGRRRARVVTMALATWMLMVSGSGPHRVWRRCVVVVITVADASQPRVHDPSETAASPRPPLPSLRRERTSGGPRMIGGTDAGTAGAGGGGGVRGVAGAERTGRRDRRIILKRRRHRDPCSVSRKPPGAA